MHIVLVCTEWLPRKGGLASFNRSLAIALAHTGNQVTCLVGGATPDDHADASATGVSLLVPQIGPGLPNLFAPVKFETAPQLVVGHDRHTGEAAAVQAGNAHARLMLVVHTNPDELEMLKNKPQPQR